MSTLQLFLICATVIILAAILRRPTTHGASIFDGLNIGDRVATYTEDGQSVVGTVVAPPNGRLVLSDAALLTGGHEQELGGSVRVPAGSVQLVQLLSSKERETTG